MSHKISASSDSDPGGSRTASRDKAIVAHLEDRIVQCCDGARRCVQLRDGAVSAQVQCNVEASRYDANEAFHVFA